MTGGAEGAAEGTVWGTGTRIVHIGDRLALRFEGLSPNQMGALGIADPRAPLPQERVALRVTVLQARGNDTERFLSPAHPSGLEWVVRDDRLEIVGRHFFATVLPRQVPGSPVAFLWTSWEAPLEFNGAVTNFARVALALGRTSARSCILHSCAAAGASRRADLFFGMSGAGKSTVGTLAIEAGRTVLSDDLNAIDISDPGEVWAQGFPWTGDHAPRNWESGRSLPLRAVFQLQKDEKSEIGPLSRSRAVAGLASCSPFLNSEPALYGQLLASLEEIVRRVPVFTLRFRKDTGFWDLVDRIAG